MGSFTGFTDATIDFFWELRFNNNREWMEQNRDRYKRVLKEPFEDFVEVLSKVFEAQIKKDLRWSISRINRDIRFSKDKSPYRSNRWIASKHSYTKGTEWRFTPEFFFELSPESYSYGMGIYSAPPAYIQLYRKKIDSNPAAFAALIKKMKKHPEFKLVGDAYKRVANPNEYSEEMMTWYKKKGLAVMVERPLDELAFSAELPTFLVEEWKKILPLYEYLNEIVVE